MTERVTKLKQQSYDAPITLSAERAVIVTDFYRENIGRYSVPVTRAKAFEYLC